MNGGTLFSGIGAPECAAPDIDWRWCAEIDRFASAVHAAHFRGVPNLGDVNRIDPDAIEPVDLVVFGSPCQSFSVAGKRLGLDDPRGNLALVALRLIGKLRPDWLVFENVPGLLSSDGGRDFGAFLGLLGECGYGFAYRILDAQHFGIPQRRRRLFVVGRFGDWRGPAAVLFEPESLRGDPPPRREAGERIADPITASFAKHHGASGGKDSQPRNHIAFGGNNTAGPVDVATACNAHGGPHGRLDFESETFVAYDVTGAPATTGARRTDIHTSLRASAPGHSEASTTTVIAQAIPVQNATRGKSQNGLGVGGESMFTLDAASQHAVAFHENQRAETTLSDTAGSLKVGGGKPGQGYPAVMAYGIGSDAVDRSGEGDGSAAERAGLAIVADASPAIRARPNNSVATVAFTASEQANGFAWERPVYPTLHGQVPNDSSNIQQGIRQGMSVRRLTPRECERLQGFPDFFTAITYRGKPAADGPRYRSLGNSMAVPVIGWILRRLAEQDAAEESPE